MTFSYIPVMPFAAIAVLPPARLFLEPGPHLDTLLSLMSPDSAVHIESVVLAPVQHDQLAKRISRGSELLDSGQGSRAYGVIQASRLMILFRVISYNCLLL